MSRPARILLQTTIPTSADDWSIARFSQLSAFLSTLKDALGASLFEVTTRDRDSLGHPDRVLANLHNEGFDSLWLFAVDAGDGLTQEDCAAISLFRARAAVFC